MSEGPSHRGGSRLACHPGSHRTSPPPPTGGGSGGSGSGPKSRYIPRDPVTGTPIELETYPGSDIPLPLPEAQGRPHTVLGGHTSEKSNPGEVYRQSAEFPGPSWPKGPGGFDVPTGRVDWSSHGTRTPHPDPHIHPYVFDISRRNTPDRGWFSPERQGTKTRGNPEGFCVRAGLRWRAMAAHDGHGVVDAGSFGVVEVGDVALDAVDQPADAGDLRFIGRRMDHRRADFSC